MEKEGFGLNSRVVQVTFLSCAFHCNESNKTKNNFKMLLASTNI